MILQSGGTYGLCAISLKLVKVNPLRYVAKTILRLDDLMFLRGEGTS